MSEKEEMDKGLEKLLESYGNWSAGLARYSVQAAYAIIAANWAVHNKADEVLGNSQALISIGICIVFLLINILIVWIITEMYFCRSEMAKNNERWWRTEYWKRANTKWPYTLTMQQLAFIRRLIAGWAPVLAGLFFMASLF